MPLGLDYFKNLISFILKLIAFFSLIKVKSSQNNNNLNKYYKLIE